MSEKSDKHDKWGVIEWAAFVVFVVPVIFTCLALFVFPYLF